MWSPVMTGLWSRYDHGAASFILYIMIIINFDEVVDRA